MTARERWEALSGRERALVGGAAVVAILVVLRYGSLSVDGGGEGASSDAAWVQLARIENYRRVLAHEGAVKAQTAQLQARFQAQQDRLTDGATATQVAAQLQGAVSQMASDAGLNVLSSQILKEEDVDGARRVGVRLTLSGELAGIASLIADVEGGAKDLVVTHLEINRKLGSTRRPPSARNAPKAQTTQPPLTMSVEVKTFLRQKA